MKNYKEIVKKLNQKLKTQVVTKGCQKCYIRLDKDKTFADDRITKYTHQIARIYIVVPQQKWNNTYLETT